MVMCEHHSHTHSVTYFMKWEKREPPNAGHSKVWQGRADRQGEKDSDFVLVIFRATLSVASGHRALKG